MLTNNLTGNDMTNKKADEDRLSEQLVIRVSRKTKANVESLAFKKGVLPTAYVREIIERSVKRAASK